MSIKFIKNIKNMLRRQAMAKAGIAVEISCNSTIYGEGDGAWVVCPDGLNFSSVIYSFGIGRDISFDMNVIAAHGAAVHAFDPTPVSVNWVASQKIPDLLKFHDYGLAAMDGEITFYSPRKSTSAHFTPVKRYKTLEVEPVKCQVRKLSTIMNELGHNRIDLLKMDIEGGEYDVIRDMTENRIPVRQILIEFHHAYETISISKTIEAIDRLRSAGFKIFDISERTYEMSLIIKQTG